MQDIDKVKNFCSQIKNKEKYPNSLKNLKGLSEETKVSILNSIKECQSQYDPEDSRYIESELIRRFLFPSKFLKTRIKEVTGPISFHQMTHRSYPQIFYIFGDKHVKTSGCGDEEKYHIGNWIKDTILSSPVFIDVYVERFYSYKDYPSGARLYREVGEENANDYLDILYLFFKDCFNQNTQKGVCKTSRFHNTDLRDLFETEDQFKVGIEFLEKIIKLDSSKLGKITPSTKETLIANVNIYINFLLDSNSIVYQRIRKQIYNIHNENIKNVIERKFEQCLEKNRKYLKPFHEIKEIEERLRIFKILEFVSCFMDYYLIARCFRTFRKTPLKNKEGSKYSRPSFNNIIYTGDYHTENYVSILQELGFETKFRKYADRGGNFQCLDISKLKQPMFWQRF